MDEPGARDTSPLITEGPVLVMAEVAMSPKVPAEPRARPEEDARTVPVVNVEGSGGCP